MKKNKLNIGLNQTWDPEKGDYIREKYEYDKSHEEIVKKEQKIKKIANIAFFIFTIVVIVGVLHLLTSV